MKVMNINKENFKTEILENEGITLIDFWAPWCAPCRMLSPIVDQVAEELENIKIGKVNVDDEQELAIQFNVMSIPTLVVLKDGKEIKRSSGFIPKSAVKELLNI